MENGKKLLDKILSDSMFSVPFYKGKLYLVVNAYITACDHDYLDVPANTELLAFCNEMNSYLSKEDAKNIRKHFDSFKKKELKDLVLYSLSMEYTGPKDYSETTSDGLFEVVEDLLEIDGGGHIVMDIGSGNGSFLAKVLSNAKQNNFVLKDVHGIEINAEQAKMSQMALDILSDGDPKPEIRVVNALDGIDFFCSRGYCFPPFNLTQFIREKVKRSKLFKHIEFTNRNTSDWVFVDYLLSGLIGNARAVAIVSGRALFNFADEEYRKALIESGMLEGIIELPNGSLNTTRARPYILVFSKRNKEVKLIDASNDYKDSKRGGRVELSPRRILLQYRNPNAPTRRIEDLKQLSNIIPSNVLLDINKQKNGVQLGELANVFTGNQYTIGVFEKDGMLSDKPTGYRILTSGDIEDGVVDWNKLRSIVYNDDKFDKYAVRKNDLVVTSKSSKVKTVVVDIEPKEKILVTGGMIIVRPNEEMLNPTYLKIFLDSNQGQLVLKSIQKGATIITINSKDLSNISIPMISLKKQNEIAEKFNEKLSTLYALKQEVRKLEDSLKNFYLDESEEE